MAISTSKLNTTAIPVNGPSAITAAVDKLVRTLTELYNKSNLENKGAEDGEFTQAHSLYSTGKTLIDQEQKLVDKVLNTTQALPLGDTAYSTNAIYSVLQLATTLQKTQVLNQTNLFSIGRSLWDLFSIRHRAPSPGVGRGLKFCLKYLDKRNTWLPLVVDERSHALAVALQIFCREMNVQKPYLYSEFQNQFPIKEAILAHRIQTYSLSKEYQTLIQEFERLSAETSKVALDDLFGKLKRLKGDSQKLMLGYTDIGISVDSNEYKNLMGYQDKLTGCLQTVLERLNKLAIPTPVVATAESKEELKEKKEEDREEEEHYDPKEEDIAIANSLITSKVSPLLAPTIIEEQKAPVPPAPSVVLPKSPSPKVVAVSMPERLLPYTAYKKQPTTIAVKKVAESTAARFTAVIDSYIATLSYFNMHGRKRALELKKELEATKRDKDAQYRIAQFIQTGKTNVDRSCCGFFHRRSHILKNMLLTEAANGKVLR